MAGDTMSRIFQAFAPLLLIVSGCSGGAADEPPLAGARIGGPFALTDPAGKTVRDGDFAGKYRIVYFGYTWCPDICPNDMLKIGQAMKTLDKQAPDKAKAIVPIFITIDPERDTPKVVGEFVRNFDDRIVGLTGTPAAIQAVTRQYAVYAKKEAPGPGGAYLVGHSQIAYLMDRDGKPITSLPIEKDAPALVAELEHWVK